MSVPIIEQKRVARSALGRGYYITGTSFTIDEAAAAFEAEVDSLIQLAESEMNVLVDRLGTIPCLHVREQVVK